MKKVQKQNKKTLDIGIPAFNEESNISHLLQTLLSQRLEGVEIKKIYVVSDGSTDSTALLARTVKDKRIVVIEGKERRGQIAAQNQILTLATADILVLINADVLPEDNLFLQSIVDPILKDRAVDLVGGRIASLAPRTFVEKIIVFSHILKQRMYTEIGESDNIYLCHGRARAFSKKLYQSIHWPQSVAEDSYSYLFCVEKGMKFKYAKDATVLFRSPNSIREHAKQSIRFDLDKKNFSHYFSKNLVAKSYYIPRRIFIKHALLSFFEHPILLIGYILIYLWIKYRPEINEKSQGPLYQISVSTKKLV